MELNTFPYCVNSIGIFSFLITNYTGVSSSRTFSIIFIPFPLPLSYFIRIRLWEAFDFTKRFPATYCTFTGPAAVLCGRAVSIFPEVVVKVLVINCGSSSVKYQLMDTTTESVLAKGIVERIGFEDAKFTHVPGGGPKQVKTLPVKNHDIAMKHVLASLVGGGGVLASLAEIGAVGHRFVNGGPEFIEPVVVTKVVLEKLRNILDIAPLHNPAHMLGIEACIAEMPDTPQVIVFDTGFHARVPEKAFMYALPRRYYEQYGIRRYGFHGTSHYFVSHRAAEIVGHPVEDLRIITCHLGNGCSIDAVKDGWAVDTSMGFTPLEGLMVGTRTGDMDIAAALTS